MNTAPSTWQHSAWDAQAIHHGPTLLKGRTEGELFSLPGTFPSPQVLVGGKSLVLWGPQPDSIVSGFPDSAALLQPLLKKSPYEKNSRPLVGLRTVKGSGAGPQGRRGSEKGWLKKGQESCFFFLLGCSASRSSSAGSF